jgi:hypothetical protein
MNVRFRDEEKAKEALQRKIGMAKVEHTNYNLDHFRDLGIGTDSLPDLMGIFFGGWKGVLNSTPAGYLYADFDASYGWESVMMEAFEDISPFLEDGSFIKIWPDYGCDYGIVENGTCVWRE